MANTCNATRRDGSPCTAPVRASGYCFYHDPAFTEKRAQGRRLGGYARSNVARFHKQAPEELRDVLGQLMQALGVTYGGQLEPRAATAMATLCSAIVRLYQLGELTDRVQAIEERDE